MEIIVFILKIILIAFLAVLGLLLTLAALVLFVPVRYDISGSIGDGWEVWAKGTIRYCLSALKLVVSFQDGQTDMQFYLFGRKMKRKSEAETEEESGKNANDSDAEEENEKTVNDSEAAGSLKKTEPKKTESEKGQTVVNVPEDSLTIDKETEEDKDADDETSAKANHTDTVESVKKEKKKRPKIDFAFWKQELTDAHNRYVIKKCWEELKYLIRHFKFRKIQTDLHFSTGDPAATGQVLGVLCMIPMLYRYEFKIVPDFEADDAYLKGTFFAAGKVRLIHILMTLLRLIFDKEVRLVTKKILKKLNK